MDGRSDGRTDGRTDGWMDGRMDGRMDEKTDGWMDGRMDGRTNVMKQPPNRDSIMSERILNILKGVFWAHAWSLE